MTRKEISKSELEGLIDDALREKNEDYAGVNVRVRYSPEEPNGGNWHISAFRDGSWLPGFGVALVEVVTALKKKYNIPEG